MTENTNGENKKKIKKFSGKMQANLLLVFCILILLFSTLIGRVVYINKSDGKRYEKRALSQQTYVSNPIPYKRGDIVDRNGTILARSEKVYKLILDPKQLLEVTEKEVEEEKVLGAYYKEPTIQVVLEHFDLTREEIDKVLEERKESQYVVMQKDISQEKKDEFEQAITIEEEMSKEQKEFLSNIKGVYFEAEYKRIYPLNEVGCSIIGFTQGTDASLGIEGYYNSQLKGTNGREYGYYNAERELERKIKKAVNGNTIVTTIDANVQQIVERLIAKFQQGDVGGKNVAVMLSNPNNGEIIAMASNTSYDLNDPYDLTPYYTEAEINVMDDEDKIDAWSEVWKNFCISWGFEPGSTFKPMTVAAALDEAIVTENSSFTCNKLLHVGDRDIKCTKAHGTIGLEQSLAQSCNVAMMKIGEHMGRTTFSKYLDIFGFRQRTGIDIPGEERGVVFSEEKLNPVQLATSSFGQSNSVTMIQMVAAFSSVINGGHYYTPHVAKKIVNENGATVKTIDKTLVRETISESTSRLIRKFLLETVETGTASPAQVAGYEIGGKTGTAEKYPRDEKNYVVSFLGCVPATDPEIVIYVVIDTPNRPSGNEQAHSNFATEFASEIMEEVLPFLGIYRDESAVPQSSEQPDEPEIEDPISQPDNGLEDDIPQTDDNREDELEDNNTGSGEEKEDEDSFSQDFNMPIAQGEETDNGITNTQPPDPQID